MDKYRDDFDGQLYGGKFRVRIWWKRWLFGLFATWHGELYDTSCRTLLFSCKKSGLFVDTFRQPEEKYVYYRCQDAAWELLNNNA